MRLALACTLAFLVLAVPASAKVWFRDMGGRTMRWDQRVTATIIGCPGDPACGREVRGVRMYIVRNGHAQRLGRVDGNGRLRFRVPRLRPGHYRLRAREGGHLRMASELFTIRAR